MFFCYFQECMDTKLVTQQSPSSRNLPQDLVLWTYQRRISNDSHPIIPSRPTRWRQLPLKFYNFICLHNYIKIFVILKIWANYTKQQIELFGILSFLPRINKKDGFYSKYFSVSITSSIFHIILKIMFSYFQMVRKMIFRLCLILQIFQVIMIGAW